MGFGSRRRAVWWSLGIVLVGFSAVPLASGINVDYSRNARYESTEGLWLSGSLVWNDGVGRISWSGGQASEPLLGAPPPGTGPRGADEFASEPLERPFYGNASRLVQLDLLVKPGGVSDTAAKVCGPGSLQIHLLLGPKWVAGAFAAQAVKGPPPEDPPPGFFFCRFRMPLETTQLPQGSVLSLRIVHVTSGSTHRYASTDEAGSILRISIFPSEEAFYRMPEAMPRRSAGGTGSLTNLGGLLGSSASAALGPLSLLGIATTSSRATSRRRVFAAGLVAAALLAAGCLAGPAEVPSTVDPGGPAHSGGTARVAQEESGDDALANESVGSVVGQVQDLNGMPVQGAHVSLLGSASFDQTDKNGLFAFTQLSPGKFRLRVDKPAFQSLEADVAVAPGQVTRVEIALAYEGDTTSGETPHFHDYWASEPSKVVLDAPILESCAPPGCHGQYGFFLFPDDSPDHNIIRPGTSNVEVTLTFRSERVGYTKVGLAVQPNNDPDASNWTLYMPKASGEPTNIRTTWEMTDVGHQLFSTWTFAIYALSIDTAPGGTGDEYVDGWVQSVKTATEADTPLIERAVITIHRGALPLEPRHPDHWKGASSLVVDSERDWRSHTVFANAVTAGFAGWSCYAYEGYYLDASLGFPRAPVPPETATLTLTAVHSRPPGFSWDLWYKGGSVPAYHYNRHAEIHTKAPSPSVSADRVTWTWTFPIEPQDADGIYNAKSAWNLALRPTDDVAACNDHMLHSADGTYLRLRWSLDAARSP